ncbi:MAG: hypothetical protein M3Y22_02860, partial [Pseudomonadota bacterium]|nr:hypothetical protein [Pseudomonadota bacterium]
PLLEASKRVGGARNVPAASERREIATGSGGNLANARDFTDNAFCPDALLSSAGWSFGDPKSSTGLGKAEAS